MSKKHFNKQPKANDFMRGYSRGKKEGYELGFSSFAYLVLLAMYNVNTEKKFLTGPKFKEFFIKTEAEVNRIMIEEYQNDPESVAELAMHHTNELRRKAGLEKIGECKDEKIL